MTYADRERTRRWKEGYRHEVEKSICIYNYINAHAPVTRCIATPEEIREMTSPKSNCHQLKLSTYIH